MQILLCDDEIEIVRQLDEFLAHCGHEVRSRTRADDLLGLLAGEGEAADLVISDICMPGRDGVGLLAALREQQLDIDVVLMTGQANDVDAARAVELGACAFLRKPLKFTEVEAIVRQVERQRADRARLRSLTGTIRLDPGQRAAGRREERFARRLHQRLFPRRLAWLHRTRAAIRHLPMAAMGSDVLDVRRLDDATTAFLLADVGGPGLSSLHGGIALKTWFADLDAVRSPAELLAEAEALIGDLFPPTVAVSALVGLWREGDRRLDYAVADHPGPLVLGETGTCRVLPGAGPALGLRQGGWIVHRTELGPHDLLVAFTDGLAEDAEGLAEHLPTDLVLGAARHDADLGLVVRGILDAAVRAEPGRAFSDDCSLLLLGPAGPAREDETARRLDGRRLMVFGAGDDLALGLHRLGAPHRLHLSFAGLGDPLAACAAEAPDLAVVDLRGNGAAGTEALDILHLVHPRLPVVAVGGSTGDARACLGRQLAGYLPAPIAPDDLLAVLRHAAHHDPARDRLRCDQVDEAWFDFVITSSPTAVELLTRYLEALGRQPLPEAALDDLVWCVREFAINAIEWGNLHQRTLEVRVSTVILPDRVMVKIADQGSGFDVRRVLAADPVAAGEQRDLLGKRPGGFGLALVRERMDEVRFNPRGDVVLLIKRLHATGIATAHPALEPRRPAAGPDPDRRPA